MTVEREWSGAATEVVRQGANPDEVLRASGYELSAQETQAASALARVLINDPDRLSAMTYAARVLTRYYVQLYDIAMEYV
jgi:hypothetical protein